MKAFEKRKEGTLCKYKTYHFIITNAEGEKKYITSILFRVSNNDNKLDIGIVFI